MVDEKKLARLLELKQKRETIDAEITVLMGGEVQKRKWTRKEKGNGAGDSGAVALPLLAGQDQ